MTSWLILVWGEKPISLKTLRSYSNAVVMFFFYLTHFSYG